MVKPDKKTILDKKSSIDKIARNDIRGLRLNKTEALKRMKEILEKHPGNVHYLGHCLKELKKDSLETVDLLNILKSPDCRILTDPEIENGCWRYRVGTQKIMAVISFSSKNGFVVVTAWRNKS